MGILVFAVWLNWLPSGGLGDLGAGYTGFRRVLDIAVHLILPTITLALIPFAIYLRVMRASMLEVMTLDFIRTARAKGAARGRGSDAPCAPQRVAADGHHPWAASRRDAGRRGGGGKHVLFAGAGPARP